MLLMSTAEIANKSNRYVVYNKEYLYEVKKAMMHIEEMLRKYYRESSSVLSMIFKWISG